MDRDRPLGLTIIAILYWIGGVFSIIGGIGLMGLGAAVAGIGTALGIFLIVLGVGAIVVGVGLWQVKEWSWWPAIIIGLLNLANGLYSLINPIQGVDAIGPIISLIIQVIILIYLFTIKGVFTGGDSKGSN